MNDPRPTAPISPLRQRLIDDMNVRRFSPETQRNYIRDVGRFATFVGRPPDTARAEDLRRFQVEQREAAVLFHRKTHTDPLRMWAKKLMEKKPFKLVAVALANKMARIAFAILRGKTMYREIPV